MPPQIDKQIETVNNPVQQELSIKPSFPKWAKYTLMCLGIFFALGLVAVATSIFTPIGPMPQEFWDNMRKYREDQALNQSTTTDQFDVWKTYKNEEYGFEFKYPNDWVERVYNSSDNNFYAESESGEKLYSYILKESQSPREYALKNIDPECVSSNDGTGDRIIDLSDKDAMIVQHCGATSESYIYVVSVSTNVLIYFNYKDDLTEDWGLSSEEKKISRFKEILSTFKFLSSSTPINNS